MKAEKTLLSETSTPNIDTLRLFRMPWSMSDNAFSWLEPTRFCDLNCEYCYQIHDPSGHKSLSEFEQEVTGLLELRRTDAVLIAGGEPLTHPDIVEIVRMVSSHAPKTLLLTNGNRLTRDMVHNLRLAGLRGFIFHVDAHQNRPGWENKTEGELNELRQRLADIVYDEGNLICGFNITIVPSTLSELPDIVTWLTANIHKVHLAVLIPVRVPNRDDQFEYFAGGTHVELDDLPFVRQEHYRDMTAMELYAEILKAIPGFRFNSYLGGTLRSTVPKWLFGNCVGTPGRICGNMGSRTMELLQNVHHLLTGRYLAVLSPWQYKISQILFLFGIVDREILKSFGRYMTYIIRHPMHLFAWLHVQTLVVMQPLDILDNGEQDLCDGCPNKTYWNGRLVSECRMEEHIRYGRVLTLAKKSVPAPNDRAVPKQEPCEQSHVLCQ
jgi:hypothetical protein